MVVGREERQASLLIVQLPEPLHSFPAALQSLVATTAASQARTLSQ